MDCIRVHHVTPHFISDAEGSASEIWRHEVIFRKDENSFISAASGSGKTSLLAYIFGERTDYSGEIWFDTREINSLKPHEWDTVRQYGVSFIFQGLRLFPGLTVLENIAVKNLLTGYKTCEEILYLVEMTGLADKKDEKAGKLSFGQQQRVAIIRALCQPFDFLLADEPFSHLDEANIEIISEIITRELQQQKAGMILCSLGPKYPFHYQQYRKL
ncbi:MAG: ATP-binding cassette domain-containing protein [Bacteroidales bacterium]|jgi:ABC-type lipoprotein export system ATPase subunit|nr:ATP-binding cassette domain-containing protein [Bacteroidales bacterium]